MLIIIGAALVLISFMFLLVPQLASLPFIGGFITSFVTWIQAIVFIGGFIIGLKLGGGFNIRGLMFGMIAGIIFVAISYVLGGII